MTDKTKQEMESRIGSSFDSFLREEGIYEEVESAALKKVIALRVGQAMKQQGVSKSELARRMGTSRSSVDRLLNPANPSATLDTMVRAASALGKRLSVGLEDMQAS